MLSLAAWPAPGVESAGAAAGTTALDGLQHCIGPDGVTIFTDRRCSDLQAVEQVRPEKPPERPGVLVSVRSCARNQDDFLSGLRMALESRDVNRLADYYHWTGMDTVSGYRLMDRLGAFSERPLVDVQLVSSLEPETGGWSGSSPNREVIDPFDANATEAPAPAPRPPRPADLLRVDQMGSNEDLGNQATYFRLRSNAGCWWIQF
ncbi:MAG: hypothetical protein KAY12_03915 [Arenimonas sp.]|nr:hypothetical protein [Arenimonas sp.]